MSGWSAIRDSSVEHPERSKVTGAVATNNNENRHNVTKLRNTVEKPQTRSNILDFNQEVPKNHSIRDVEVSTNGKLLAREFTQKQTIDATLRAASVRTLKISLDTLDQNV